ncbi:MAG: glutamine-hydrolyzing GMP synthase [Candidatus Aenigmarchaeota archaeon]|nr:glutamine-hydrolyzing GMP synthase [Candidatus Aenigmarchaeota archaeon]
MDTIVVIDFGGQYSHLISRRVRDNGVFSSVVQPDISAESLKKTPGLKGVILSGGAASVYDNDSPKCDENILKIGVPVLGICYGHQLIAYLKGGKVKAGDFGEYGTTQISVTGNGELLRGLEHQEPVWMNHRDIVANMPEGYIVTAKSANAPVAALENRNDKIYGVQFHPEVSHTEKGNTILSNFIFEVCGAKKDWRVEDVVQNLIAETKMRIGDGKAIMALSGGVDSSVAAAIASKAIGRNLTAVYVDTGLMRHKETEFVQDVFSKHDMNLRIVDAHERFFSSLKDVTEPEEKRKVIGGLFAEIFIDMAKEENAEFLIQGTIYSDRIESGVTKHSSSIKSHHNVGGLPEDLKLKLCEPLKELYKDEVRKIAKSVGLPDEITSRHVFPGPGLAIRILGEVTPEKARIARTANLIVEEEMKNAGLYGNVWMAFAVLLPIKTVGIQGDSRSYKHAIALRIIESEDAMTANFSKVPYDVLEKISTRITNEIPEVNRVVYDISNKPPATMEWE